MAIFRPERHSLSDETHSDKFVGENFFRERAPSVHFAGLVFDPDACTLVRDSGEAIPLTRGELSLLRVFVGRPGRVLSRDTLLSSVANRNLEPFDRSMDVLVGRLRRKIEPDSKAPSLIVTVPGEGYRFDGLKVAPVHAHTEAASSGPAVSDSGDEGTLDDRAPEGNSSSPLEPRVQATGRPTSRMRFTAAIAAALSLLAAGAYGWQAGLLHPPTAIADKLATAPRLSIVVLPFENLSGDPDQDHFADGITDDLTTDLSHLSGSLVISHGTAFTYKGRAIDPCLSGCLT